MSPALAGWLQVGLLLVALGVCWRPLGDYIARVVTSASHWRAERGLYRVMGVDPAADQQWGAYLRSMLAFSAISVLFLYGMLRLQHYLLLSLGMPDVPPALAWNTAASFTTNTNWQNYSGESTLGYLVQMSGLAVQNFLSAAVGIAVAVALVRGFIRSRTGTLGNFWVDLTRVTIRVLLPLAIIGGLVLAAGGVVDNFTSPHTISTLTGGHQAMVGGPVASQEVIKEMGNNGGGFFNANSAHPFENPSPFTNLFEIFLILVIPFALTRTFGAMVKDKRQGYALLAIMAILWLASVAGVTFFEAQHAGQAAQAAHAAMEGKEVRFGIPGSSLFAASTTVTSTGAVNSFHDSFTPFGGGIVLFNMMMGEVVPGGVGAGLYGILILAIITVFVGGLMVGRTPEYIGKKIRPAEMKYAALYILTTPAIVLFFAALSIALSGPRASILNPGPHGLTEIMYAFTSMANNNGSAFAGLTTATTWYNTTGGIAMLLGRFAPQIFALALAGSLARQQAVPASAGTMPTHRLLFVGMVIGVILIIVGLTFFPALALGPFAEGLH
ncbi:MAG: potassium-transporting ATPase subunit KdpA [Nocardiopsaceae bacterium]|jgi:K+-transporting ATPase ATPase A chain|nr:potassium-transporting ATPase subunit KdpA [Nocardiopsaceae bacterium]